MIVPTVPAGPNPASVSSIDVSRGRSEDCGDDPVPEALTPQIPACPTEKQEGAGGDNGDDANARSSSPESALSESAESESQDRQLPGDTAS